MKQTLQTLLTYGREQLKRKGSPDPELDAKYLLLEAFRTDMVHFLMNRSRELPETVQIQEMISRYREMIARRGKRIPLQQILGTQEFMGLSFYVNRHVLIPRQDTETLVEWVLKEHPGNGETVLDLCTGSGCIAISLAVKGNYGWVSAVDLSHEALKIAEKNKNRLLTEENQGLWVTEEKQSRMLPEEGQKPLAAEKKPPVFELLEGDLFHALESSALPEKQFDLLVSNPPYIPTNVIETLEPEVREHEPRMALDGSPDGLEFYRRIAKEAGNYLKDGASVYLEIGYDQGESVREILESAGFSAVRIIPDAAGNDRVAAAWWCKKP